MDDYIECWFVGGPWKDRLIPIHHQIVSDKRRAFRVPILENKINVFAIYDGPITDSPMQIVDYYQQHPLETGTPVYSCLNEAAFGRSGWHFGLTSVKARKVR